MFRRLRDVAVAIDCRNYHEATRQVMVGVSEATCLVDGHEVTLTDWSFLDRADVRDYLSHIADAGFTSVLVGQFSIGGENQQLIERLAAEPLSGQDMGVLLLRP